MNSNDSVWLDPPHLPRAPILQHNVSLCHGRAPPLSPALRQRLQLRPVAWSRVYGILDFGKPNGTAECRSRRAARVAPPPGRRRFFNMHISPSDHLPLLSFSRVTAFVPLGVSLSTPFSEIQRAYPRCNLGWVVKILPCFCDATLYPELRHGAVLREITIPDDNVLSMTPRNLDETSKSRRIISSLRICDDRVYTKIKSD